MSYSWLLTYSILTLSLLIILIFKNKQVLHPSVITVFIYFYATVGPLWAHYLYDTQLPLVAYSKIDQSILVFMCATLGIFLGSLIPRININRGISVKTIQSKKLISNLIIIISIFNMAAFFILMIKINIILSFDKGYLLSDPLFFLVHRNYTLFMFIIIPIIYYLKTIYNEKSNLILYNILFYFTYMILTQERDFVLVVVSMILVHHYHINKIKLKMIFSLFLGVITLFSSLFALRVVNAGGEIESSAIENLLNQGSNITIVSNIIEYVDTYGHTYGYTYYQSLINLTPSFIYRLGIPLTDWFVITFFPTSSSGYGFGLDAEAYLNGGYIMCLVFFIFITYAINNLFVAMKNGSLILGSLFCFIFPLFLYSIRGDSLMLFKGSFIALCFVFLVIFISFKKIYVYK